MKRMRTILRFTLLLLPTWLMAQTMPRINLTYSTLDKDTFNVGTFQLIQDSDTLALNMQVRHRGASSLYYDKPSYAIKLTDSIGQSVDTALLGMRQDNYWILDAMASDLARMRNRVSMDLWLEFSRQPWYWDQEPKLINGYRGQMVTVYLNGSAQGIYHLSERIDRKQLKLKKYSAKKGIQGTLYKPWRNISTSAWILSYSTPTPDSTQGIWDSWEVKYPDLEDGEPITWTPLYNSIQFAQKTGKTFSDSIGEYVDLPVFIDYILFTQLLSARDNDRKNNYLSYYTSTTQRAVYTPWDLDHSLGRQYNGNIESPTAEGLFNKHRLYDYLTRYYHLQDTLRARYVQLREHYFTVEHIDSLCAPYFELYAATGMDTLEQRLWSGHNKLSLDIPAEQDYIHEWMIEHLEYLDSVYHYQAPYTPTYIATHLPSSLPAATKHFSNGLLYIQRAGCRYDCLGRPYKP